MRVIITGSVFGYPNGTGASARAHAYASGFLRCGVESEVICLKPTEKPSLPAQNRESRGIIAGVPFSYGCGRTVRSNLRAMNLLLFVRGLYSFVRRVRQSAKDQPTAVVALVDDDPLTLLALVVLCRLARVKVVCERSEFPFVYSTRRLRNAAFRFINNRIGYPNLDGVVVISSLLERHFRDMLGGAVKVHRVPIMVDLPQLKPSSESSEKVVMYCGNLDHKGEVDSVIQTFHTASGDEGDWRLEILGGSSNTTRLAALRNMCRELGIEDRVIFHGPVPRVSVYSHLLRAAVLVLPRRDALFSRAGFPTKLAEYLATGKPVVVTATGDIPMYLQDSVSAFLVPANDDRAFSAKLEVAMSDKVFAQRVGMAGRQVAEANFDSRVVCSDVLTLLKSLQSVQ
jgi:glycosyltransferase involved in cell wall biosynthesis